MHRGRYDDAHQIHRGCYDVSAPVGQYPEACDEADAQHDGYFGQYGSCKFLATTNPLNNSLKAFCRGGFMCEDGDYDECSDGHGMKYPNDFIVIRKPIVGDCTGKDCPVMGVFEGNFFIRTLMVVLAGLGRNCGIPMRSGRIGAVAFRSSYVDHIAFGCSDDAESTFNASESYCNKPDDKTVYYPLAEEHKCRKGARSYYYKYDKDDGEYYRLETTLMDFWGTVKKTVEERNGIRHYKVKVGLTNKLPVA